MLADSRDTEISGAARVTLTVSAGQTLHGTGEIGVAVVNQGTIAADQSGVSLTLGAAVDNQGTLHAVNRGLLAVSGAVTNTGTIVADQRGGSVTLGAAVSNQGTLSAMSGGTLTVSGLVTNTGTVRATGGGSLKLAGGLTTSGTFQVEDGATVVLSGPVQMSQKLRAAPGTLARFVDAEVTSAGAAVVADGGTVEIVNSTLTGGVLRATDNAASIVQFSGDVTFNGVPWDDLGAGRFRVFHTTARLLGDYAHQLPAGYTLVVEAGPDGQGQDSQWNLPGGTFVNDGRIELRAGYGCNWFCYPTYATLGLESSTTLTGSGAVVLTGSYEAARIAGAAGSVLTVGPGETVQGRGQISLEVVNGGLVQSDQSGGTLAVTGSVTNTGTVRAVGGGYLRLAGAVTSQATIEASGGGRVAVEGPLLINGGGRLAGDSTGLLSVGGDLVGNTQNADQYGPWPTVIFAGAGTPDQPQRLEVLGKDLGAVAAGFTRNFVYSTLALANNTYVRLVDEADNAAGVDAEAVYVDSLVVPAGTTLDLNGLHLYSRAAQVSGRIVGGTITQVPDSGPLTLNSATSGTIGVSGELDEWTFFGRAGRTITVVANPGGGGSPASLAPYLGFAQVQLLDATDQALAMAESSADGQIVTLADVVLPADGDVSSAGPGGDGASGKRRQLPDHDLGRDDRRCPPGLQPAASGKD